MRIGNFGLVGLVGTLVFLAGAHLLWVNRDLAMTWLVEFVRILRREFARREPRSGGEGAATAVSPAARVSRGHSGALVLVSALALILIGQLLLLIDLMH